jgi:hypothetical protein
LTEINALAPPLPKDFNLVGWLGDQTIKAAGAMAVQHPGGSSIMAAETIDPDKVKAAFDKCALKVTLQKRPKAAMAEKRIPISKG